MGIFQYFAIPQITVLTKDLTLALDCSTQKITLALLSEKKILTSLQETPENQHSSVLLRKIKKILDETEVSLKDITHLLYCHGPGSFTSLRIGFAMLLGLFYGQDIVYSSFSSLLLRALSQHKADTPSVAILRASRGKMYCGFYDENFFEEKILTPQEFLEWTKTQGKKIDLNVSHKETFSEKEWEILEDKVSEIIFDTIEPEALPALLESPFLQTSDLKKAKLNYLQAPDIGQKTKI